MALEISTPFPTSLHSLPSLESPCSTWNQPFLSTTLAFNDCISLDVLSLSFETLQPDPFRMKKNILNEYEILQKHGQVVRMVNVLHPNERMIIVSDPEGKPSSITILCLVSRILPYDPPFESLHSQQSCAKSTLESNGKCFSAPTNLCALLACLPVV